MKPIKHKAFAYVTFRNHLLVFRHISHPEAGIQVPAGSIKPGESPDVAALREAQEETGLQDLILVSYLGEHVRDMADDAKDEFHHRHFYHLQCTQTPPETWQHAEPDPPEGGDDIGLFEFFWGMLPDQIPPLIADHGVLLPLLIKRLSTTGWQNYEKTS